MGQIKVRYAESLADIYGHIESINQEIQRETGEKERPLLWYRGHANANYNLEPNIFRKAEYKFNEQRSYSSNHLREDYRFQSFMSRNYANLNSSKPQSVIEWQEVMQHYFTKTRLMDWSESLTVSLDFALEAFISPIKNQDNILSRKNASPVIWILQPVRLNMEVYNSFKEKKGKELIRKAIGESKKDGLANRIYKEFQKVEVSKLYWNNEIKDEKNIQGIIGLSSLEMLRNSYRGREREALKSFEMNPFFYLLLRYYSDGVPVEMGSIPPLAIIHPYHSERIKMQKGVFTIFPYYIPDGCMEMVFKEHKYYPSIGMECMSKCIPYLHCIQITNPEKVARELLLTGSKRGNLYPDMQVVSQDLENVVE